jgi:hypothetical protein
MGVLQSLLNAKIRKDTNVSALSEKKYMRKGELKL